MPLRNTDTLETEVQNTDGKPSDSTVDLERQDTATESFRTRIIDWASNAGRSSLMTALDIFFDANRPFTMSVLSIRAEQGGIGEIEASGRILIELAMHLSESFGSGASGGDIVDDTSASPGADVETTSTEPEVATTEAAAESTSGETETGDQAPKPH